MRADSQRAADLVADDDPAERRATASRSLEVRRPRPPMRFAEGLGELGILKDQRTLQVPVAVQARRKAEMPLEQRAGLAEQIENGLGIHYGCQSTTRENRVTRNFGSVASAVGARRGVRYLRVACGRRGHSPRAISIATGFSAVRQNYARGRVAWPGSARVLALPGLSTVPIGHLETRAMRFEQLITGKSAAARRAVVASLPVRFRPLR